MTWHLHYIPTSSPPPNRYWGGKLSGSCSGISFTWNFSISWVLLIVTLLLVGFSRFAKRELSEISASSQLEGQTSGVHVSISGARQSPSNVVPIAEDDLNVAPVACWSRRQRMWLYIEMPGHSFGVSSAVVNFCRFGALSQASSRRFCAAPTVTMFDDASLTEEQCSRGAGQHSYKGVVEAHGGTLAPAKSQPGRAQRI